MSSVAFRRERYEPDGNTYALPSGLPLPSSRKNTFHSPWNRGLEALAAASAEAEAAMLDSLELEAASEPWPSNNLVPLAPADLVPAELPEAREGTETPDITDAAD